MFGKAGRERAVAATQVGAEEIRRLTRESLDEVGVKKAEALSAVQAIHTDAYVAFEKIKADARATIESDRLLNLTIQDDASRAAIMRIEAAGKRILDQVAFATGTINRRSLAARAIVAGTLDDLMPCTPHIVRDRLGALAHWVETGQWPDKPAADSGGGSGGSGGSGHAGKPIEETLRNVPLASGRSAKAAPRKTK